MILRTFTVALLPALVGSNRVEKIKVSEVSGNNLSTKQNSVQANCHKRKLLILSSPLVQISKSGLGNSATLVMSCCWNIVSSTSLASSYNPIFYFGCDLFDCLYDVVSAAVAQRYHIMHSFITMAHVFGLIYYSLQRFWQL